MNEILIAIFIFGIITVLFGTLIVLIRKKRNDFEKDEEMDYRAFFILGICFLPIGFIFSITIENPGFFGISALGLIYISIALANRDKWKKNT